MASLVVYMFAMGQAIYFREERVGGGGGLAKTEKKIMHKKRRRTSSYTTKHGKEWEDFMQVPPPLDKPILLRLPNLRESAMKRFPG